MHPRIVHPSAVGALGLPAGMRDLLPPRASERRRLARTVLEAFERYGYELVTPPAFEREAVVARAVGGAARRELVRFLDPDSGEVLALRPDMTPQVARIAATRLRHQPPPLRLAYEGSVVRRPSARTRRQRQVSQAGVECVGWPSPDADVEVMRAVLSALGGAGVGGLTVELSHAGALQAVVDELPEGLRDEVAEAFALHDAAGWRALLRDHPSASARAERCFALAGDASLLDGASGDGPLDGVIASLRALRDALARSAPDVANLVDLGELRGRGYYTGPFFQVLCDAVALPLGGGGRYDALLSRFGHDLAATGAALDLEAVEEALTLGRPARDEPAPARVLVVGPAPRRGARADELRAAGHAVGELEDRDDDEVARYAERWRYPRVERVGPVTDERLPREGGR